MKTCVKCSAQSNDNAAFCALCGTAFTSHTDFSNISETVNESSVEIFAPLSNYGEPLFSQHPVINTLKEAGSSKLFLAAVILLTLSIILGISSTIVNWNTESVYVERMEEYEEFNAESIEGFVEAINVGVAIALIPTVLACIGMWHLYAVSRSRRDIPISTTGLGMIKAYAIINLVGILLIPLLVILALIVGSSSTAEPAGEAASNAAVGIIVIIFFAIILVLPVMYFISVFRTVNTVKRTAVTAVPSNKVSGFLGVMNYIIAGIYFFGILGADSLLAIITALVNTAFLIIISICLFSYKNKMSLLMYGTQYPYMPYGQIPASQQFPQY